MFDTVRLMAIANPRAFVADEPILDPEEGVVRVSRELRKHGGSTVVSLHPKILEAVSLAEDDQVEIIADMDKREIVIRPVESAEE